MTVINVNDLNGFIKAVKDMRTTQKEYFKTKARAALYKAKDLEKQVDNYVEKFEG